MGYLDNQDSVSIRFLSEQEKEYRTCAICHFYQFGVIPASVGIDFIKSRILLEKQVILPPHQQLFLGVRLSKRGRTLCKKWARMSGFDLNKTGKVQDIYELESMDRMDKFLMSEKRLKTEMAKGKGKKLIEHYEFNIL